MTHNNSWLINKIRNGHQVQFLFFWGHQPNKDGSISKTCFSQWWVAPFEVAGITYKTAEHWMMAGKARLFNNNALLEQIIAAESPAEAKKLGRLVEQFDPVIWDKEKFNLVVTGNLQKFSADKRLKDFLINTGDQVLVEASPVDAIWGIGLPADHAEATNPEKWRGENLLGYALMEVRDQLKKEIATK